MTEQIGLWRATYIPGDWIVLGGPTSLVILKPAATYLSALIEQLWRAVLDADSLDALVAELAKHNVSQMPDFAAFFWHGGSMRSLIRGDVEVTDLDSGDVIAEGADVRTWNEVGLGDVRRVRVELGAEGSTPGSGLRLPLVVGAASAGCVELDATQEALVSSPQGSTATLSPPAAVPVPIPGQPPIAEIESDRSAVVDAEVVEDRAVRPDPGEEAPVRFNPFAQEDEALQLFGEGEQRPQPERPFSPFDQPQYFDQSVDEPESADEAEPIQAAGPPPVPSTDQQQPRSPVDPHNPFAVPAVEDREDGSPRDPFAQQRPVGFGAPPPLGAGAAGAPAFGAPGLGIPPQASTGFGGPPVHQAPREGTVLGVTCAMGHPNPPDAQRCRRCGGPLQGQPRLMPQPVMVVLRPNSGQPVEVDRSVLIGRSPQASKASGDESPRLMTVVSPSTDISRTHLQVSPDGWETVATDLHSTNGTFLIRPGQPEPERLAPGERVRIFPGCVLDLGDGVSIHVDHPA